MEADLRSRILADASLARLVTAERTAWGDRPQASGLPAITLDTVSDARPQHMAGNQALRDTRVQVDVWSLDKIQAQQLRDLVIAAVVPAGLQGATRFRRSFVNDVRASWEKPGTAVVYRETIDLTVWHAAAV